MRPATIKARYKVYDGDYHYSAAAAATAATTTAAVVAAADARGAYNTAIVR